MRNTDKFQPIGKFERKEPLGRRILLKGGMILLKWILKK
jgi:hypothetical protein